MHKSVLLAIGGLALVAASGANAEFRAPGDVVAQASPTSPGMGGAASAAQWKGKDLVDSTGDKIGEIKDVQGEMVIVSVGGFLGIGQKDVQMSRDRLTVTGSGSDLKVQTSMTKDQIKDLPEHRASDTGRGMGGSSPTTAPSPGGTTPTR